MVLVFLSQFGLLTTGGEAGGVTGPEHPEAAQEAGHRAGGLAAQGAPQKGGAVLEAAIVILTLYVQ